MTREDYANYCRSCSKKDFDPRQGIICSLTNAVATFENECPDYDGTVPSRPSAASTSASPVTPVNSGNGTGQADYTDEEAEALIAEAVAKYQTGTQNNTHSNTQSETQHTPDYYNDDSGGGGEGTLDIVLGIVFLVGGIVASAASDQFIFYGAVVVGIIKIIRGVARNSG